ncbi:BppU family phage baseplate upper protein [Anaerotignum sp. MB30-C6]|uniref:BppU family phage baseplate upper protein n=1 Tax=Anaerotignum sp. MB30-C6 TaxID=3070814 RepID=UPI0027DCC1F9|nr:BppU family phage baseplate upper protein [Anaerotignum sp. MB30-C6]WMI80346.1 BppU family phage baseplate upper protein [Anaerotignum sp. MB30-C6]
MAQIYKKLEIDVNKEVMAIITAVQKDAKSRYLDVVLLDGSTAINLTGHEVGIYGKKADGTEIYNNGVITEATNGRCQFELTDQALAVAQDLEVQIVIYHNNVEILQSLPFKIKVVKSLISEGAVESSNEYGALVVLYQNLYEAYDLMTTMVQNIGVPGAIAAGLTIDTMWDAWEFMCNYLKVDLTNLLQNAINNNSVDGVIQRIGETTDTGATENTGGVLGKLNTLLTRGCIKSVQRGLRSGASGTSAAIEIIIKSVDPSKCFVILNNGGIGSGSTSFSYIYSLTDVMLKISPNYYVSGSFYHFYVSWQVVEFY